MQAILEMLTNLDIYAFVYMTNLFKQCNYRLTPNSLQC